MSARIRPVSVTLSIEAVVDDGEILTPVQIAPVRLMPAQLAQFDLIERIADLQAQLDAQAAAAPVPPGG